jgi:hypothetical protein
MDLSKIDWVTIFTEVGVGILVVLGISGLFFIILSEVRQDSRRDTLLKALGIGAGVVLTLYVLGRLGGYVWELLPDEFRAILYTWVFPVSFIVGVVILPAIGLIGAFLNVWRNWGRGEVQENASKILDKLEAQVGADKRPDVALTMDALRTELDTRERKGFRQDIALAVAFFIIGGVVSVAIQLWVGR